MGARSKINFIREEKRIVSVYNQFDGYLLGTGKDIVNFLKKGKLVNGIPENPEIGKIFNGIECLAAQYIKEHKDRVGGLYICTETEIVSYEYDVIQIGERLIIRYEGKKYGIDDFETFINLEENE